jgi:hypothetical protein
MYHRHKLLDLIDYINTEIFISKPVFTHWATLYRFQVPLSNVSALSVSLVIVPLSFRHEMPSYPTYTDLFICLINIHFKFMCKLIQMAIRLSCVQGEFDCKL